MKGRTAIVLGVIALVLFVTNPTQDEYVSWFKQQASQQAGGGADGALAAFLGGAIFSLSTTREDYYFYSIYKTDVGSGPKLKVVGLFRFFIPLPPPTSGFPHVIAADTEGHWLPEDGYTWIINPPVAGDLRVKWTPGRLSTKNPHVVAADAEGHWLPDDGYTWIINPPVAGDFRVKWTAGRLSTKNPHVVAADAEGRWLPESGYKWVANPPVAGDFRVRPLASGN